MGRMGKMDGRMDRQMARWINKWNDRWIAGKRERERKRASDPQPPLQSISWLCHPRITSTPLSHNLQVCSISETSAIVLYGTTHLYIMSIYVYIVI